MANRVPPSSPTPATDPPTPRAPEAPAETREARAISHGGAAGFADESATKVRGQGAVSPVRTSSLSSPDEAHNAATTRVAVGELRAALRASKRSDPPGPASPGSTRPETARGDALARKLDALDEVASDPELPPTPRMPSNPSLAPPDERAIAFDSCSEAAPRPLSHADIEELGGGPSSEVPSTKRSSTAPPLDAGRARNTAYAYVVATLVVLLGAFLGLFVASGGSFARMMETLLSLVGH